MQFREISRVTLEEPRLRERLSVLLLRAAAHLQQHGHLSHLLAEAVQSNEFLESVHVRSLGWQSTSLWSQKIDHGRIADSYARNS